MKGYRFYAEYPEGRSNRLPVTEATNVVAVSTEDPGRGRLRKRCKRAKESVARQIHPELFKRLDAAESES